MKILKLKMAAAIAASVFAITLAGVGAFHLSARADGAPGKAAVTVQLEVLSAEPGLYDRVTHPSNGKSLTGGRVYPALIKAGAKVLETPRIEAFSGTQAMIAIGPSATPADSATGQPNASSPSVGNTFEATTRLAPDGTVGLSATCTRTEPARDASAGSPPQTNSESISIDTPISKGHDAFIGKLPAMPGYGDQTDLLVFAQLVEVKPI